MKKAILYPLLLLCLLVSGCAKQEASVPEANTTVTLYDRTVRFALPDGLTAEPSQGLEGDILQYLLFPAVYTFPDPIPSPSGADWGYSGRLDIYNNFADFENGAIVRAPFIWNHSTPVSDYGPVEGTGAPSYLFRECHDLYTAPERERLWDAGVYPEDTIPEGADFWHIVFARPGEKTMVAFSLNCEVFTQDDAIALAKSVVIQ